MPILSVPGIGSGLDIEGIINSLMAVEQIPLQRLQFKAGDYLAQISAYGQLRSAMASFQDSAAALKSFDDFDAFSAKSGDDSIFTVTADNDVALGSYDILVDSLAKSQKQGSTSFVDTGSTTIGNAGDQMTMTIGTEAFTIDIGGKTLSEIQTAINEATGNVGVTAGIIQENDSSFHLVLSSDNTGTTNAMTLSFADSLGAVITDPLGFTEIQPAADAQITIDNAYTITRSSNTISDAIQGVTIDLLNASPDAVSLDITRDAGAISSSVQKFVGAYNELLSSLNSLKQGNLSGDGTLRLVESQLRSVLGSSASLTGAYSYASQVGITFERDGTLSFDSAELADALENDLTAVADLFANDDQGLAFRLDSMLEGMLGDDGLIDAREDGLNARVDNNNDQMEAMQRRLEMVEARYRSQFTALDSLLGQLQATSSYVTAQLSSLENLLPGNSNK
jgi:flagellar hook-associated protein 2